MLLGWKNQYCENDYTTKCNLQTQCNSYQITNDSFHRTRTKYFTIRIEMQKALSSQSNFGWGEWSWRNQPSWLQTVLRSSCHQGSVALAQKQDYRPMKQDRKSRYKPTHLWAPYLLQRRHEYTIGKTQSFQ